jgi:hypothetical protein
MPLIRVNWSTRLPDQLTPGRVAVHFLPSAGTEKQTRRYQGARVRATRNPRKKMRSATYQSSREAERSPFE